MDDKLLEYANQDFMDVDSEIEDAIINHKSNVAIAYLRVVL